MPLVIKRKAIIQRGIIYIYFAGMVNFLAKRRELYIAIGALIYNNAIVEDDNADLGAHHRPQRHSINSVALKADTLIKSLDIVRRKDNNTLSWIVRFEALDSSKVVIIELFDIANTEPRHNALTHQQLFATLLAKLVI